MLRRLGTLCLFSALLSSANTTVFAQVTIHVPADKPTIQLGINAASNGDTVLVDAGTYFENLVFNGKTITLTGVTPAPGQNPPTILDGSSKGPAISIADGESPTIANFTVQHGGNFATATPSVAATGGIVISNGSPTIVSNLIRDNNCWGITGAGSPYIEYNTISATQDPTGDCGFAGGAGILIAGDRYIAISSTYIPATVFANTIQNNVQNGFEETGSSGGAGIAITGGEPVIVSNIIHDNASPGGTGAGINVFVSAGHSGRSVAILQNILYNNHAGCGGGGIATPTSRDYGQTNLLIANNTLVNNTGDDNAGYMECASISQIYPAPASATDFDTEFLSGPGTVIVNNIITSSTTNPAVNCTPLVPPSEAIQPLFDHNILYNPGGAFFGSFCVDESAQYHNLTVDPGFDPANPYHPALGSPAIDAGNNSALAYIQQVTGIPLVQDAAGANRVQDATGEGYPAIDIGAYELTPAGGITTDNGPTTVVLTSSAYSGPGNSNFTLSATIAASSAPTGSITFYSDDQELGSAPISNNVATMTFTLGPGVHGVYATYNGLPGIVAPAISIPIIIDVALITTRILLQSTAFPQPPYEQDGTSFVGQSVKFTITASSDDNYIPTPISLTNLKTNTVLAPALMPDSAGVATFTTSFAVAGQYPIEAAYRGDKTHTTGGDTLTQIVNGYPTTTSLGCPSTILAFGASELITATVTSTYGTPTGTVDFSDAGAPIGQAATLANGAASVTYSATLSGNRNRTIIASYRPSAGSPFADSSTSCSIYVEPQNTLVLTSSSPLVNNIPTSPAFTPITFTATLTNTTDLTGKYSLTIQSSAGSSTYPMTVDASETVATYTTSSLAPGQYNVSAAFTSSDNSVSITARLSPYQRVTAPTGDFTLTGPSPVTTRTESTASGTLNLTSINNFQGTVTLSCNFPLPTTYTCTLSPTSVPLTVGGTGSVSVTLTPSLNRASNAGETTARIVLASLLPLTMLSLAGFVRRRRFAPLLPLAILAIVAASTTACGNDIYYTATQPGSYPFTITATGTTKGATNPNTHILNITLVLTP